LALFYLSLPAAAAVVVWAQADEEAGSLSLTVRVVDAETAEPIEYASVSLSRADGSPIRDPNPTWRTDAAGVARCDHLTPGVYWLSAIRRAHLYGQTEYAAGSRIRVEVVADVKNDIEIRLHAVVFDQIEVERRWPWCVTGTVTDGRGQPLPGVEVRAHCGAGTLRQTGKVTSDAKGRYTLRFLPGMHMLIEQTDKWGAGLQAATITAHKAGHYEENLSRHGGLYMAGKPQPKENAWGANPDQVVLPNQPYRLDFVMVPAARVEGTLVDHLGRPVSDCDLWLTGDELPPSSSVVAGAKTDGDGRFTIADLPCKAFWFTLRHARHLDLTTDPIDFTAGGVYRVKLVYDQSIAGPPSLTCPHVFSVTVPTDQPVTGEAGASSTPGTSP